MRSLAATSMILAMLLAAVPPAKPDTFEFSESGGSRLAKRQVKWSKRKIPIALSSSLSFPGSNIKFGSDVLGAARRALTRWASNANITFVETSATAQSISSVTGDGINLITIADTDENNAIFTNAEMTGRTRLFYDPDSGVISEADICINPHPTLSDSTPVQFSTDGTPGTYDLESTFTHEIGHFLGLDHSAVLASTMQAHQGLNGVYGLPAFTGRTLSEEDRERVRSLYGPQDKDGGAIEGKIIGSYAGAWVWVENSVTGRVAGATTVTDNGSYRVDALLPGQYRVLIEQPGTFGDIGNVGSKGNGANQQDERFIRTTEVANQITVNAHADSVFSSTIVPSQPSTQILNPRLLGLNGEVSTVALPLEAGKSFTIYLGGEGVDQIPATAISINSPFFKVDPNSLRREQFGSSFPVISFDLAVAANAPFGDYTIRLQSNSGEIAYLAGGVTLDPGVNSTAPNPVDDARFFVGQHYHDFLGREPDRSGVDYWVAQLEQCGSDVNCTRGWRLAISAAFFGESEFQQTGSFVYGLYKSLGRRPSFSEFGDDRGLMIGDAGSIESKRTALAVNFVGRPEFIAKYPLGISAEQFIVSLLAEISPNSAPEGSSERKELLALYDGTKAGRAAVVSQLIASPSFVRAEYSHIFVLMQYFAYLRRDPDEAGYNFWLTFLQNKQRREADGFRAVACAFLSSTEYQARFGMVITHTTSECGS